jgi:response regulator RpfG family c-di-GMP phosphodiesterase
MLLIGKHNSSNGEALQAMQEVGPDLSLMQLRRQLEAANEELQQQRELARIAILNERKRADELTAVTRQLQAFAQDFRLVRRSERERRRQMLDAQADTVVRLLRASRFRDQETGVHIWRVGLYSKMVAEAMGLGKRDAEILYRAAPLHDVGKIGVPDLILRKPGKLNPAEWLMMREHTRIGAQLLEGSHAPVIEAAHSVAFTHHENFDGSGYPRGLRGEEIPLMGRIVRLADVYDALRMERPYKTTLTHEEASAIILRGDGRTSPSHFDPRLLEVFCQIHATFDFIYNRCRTEAEADEALQESMEGECVKFF